MQKAKPIFIFAGLVPAGLVLVLTSCNSLQLKSEPPKPISSKPPASAIVLAEPVTVNDKNGTNVFPPGKYKPVEEDKGGYYFQAPGKILVTDVASFGFQGGLYVPRGTTEPTQWYVMETSGKKMGRFKTVPPHKLIH